MGNRAVIAFVGNTNPLSQCIYLHWNGGRASVEAFLGAAKALNIRRPDPRWGQVAKDVAIEQLANLIGPWFFGNDPGLTVYIESYARADKDNGDNGLYLIDNDLNIVRRDYCRGGEEIDSAKTAGIIQHIVERAPVFND